MGYFELDFLTDVETGETYLGELNPRVTGASSITNHAVFALADMPLFLFHLLEWMDVEYELDIDDVNKRWADDSNRDNWSQLVLKSTDPEMDILTEAPPTGIWTLERNGELNFSRYDTHRRAVEDEWEAFFLRILKPGEVRYKGADLGILVTRGRLMNDQYKLNSRAHAFINGLKKCYKSRPFYPHVRNPEQSVEIGGFKML